MNFGLEGAVVLVTGASSGIGKATALAFAEEGARVALTYQRNAEQAEETATLVRERGADALVLQLTLEEPDAPAKVVERVRHTWGGLQVLVNNAVRWPTRFVSTEELPLDELELSLRANVIGPIALIKAALPLMRASHWGRIVNVSTGLVIDGSPGSTLYTAPKSAMHGFTRTLAKEVGADNILANVLMAGAVHSEVRQRPAQMLDLMAKAATTGRLTLADEVARAAVFLGSRANGHVQGEAIRVDGFFVTPHRWNMPKPS